MVKMNKPKVRMRCYSTINNFINSSKRTELKCDVVVACNDKVMIFWNVPVIIHELTFKDDEKYFTLSVWWNEHEKCTGDLIANEELPDMFDSRFIKLTSIGDSEAIHFSNSWKTMLRCCFMIHQASNEESVESVANEYKICQG